MGNEMFDLSGKVAIVTGAGRGIGRGVALGLADAGADLGLVSRTADEIKAVAEKIEAKGRKAETVAVDISDTDRIQETVDTFVDRFGRIDILVNNAGTNIPTDAVDITVEVWNQIMDLNMRSLFFLSQAVGKVMMGQDQGGGIINISSVAADAALAKRSAYCASKAGVNLLTRCLALEWGPNKVRVNAVAPTFTVTEMTKKFMKDPSYLDFAMKRNLLGRMAEPEDFVGAVVYLASDASSMVTGHILSVDAGWTV